MSTLSTPQIMDVPMDELKQALERAKRSMSEQDHQLLENLAASYVYLTQLLEDKTTTIERRWTSTCSIPCESTAWRPKTPSRFMSRPRRAARP